MKWRVICENEEAGRRRKEEKSVKSFVKHQRWYRTRRARSSIEIGNNFISVQLFFILTHCEHFVVKWQERGVSMECEMKWELWGSSEFGVNKKTNWKIKASFTHSTIDFISNNDIEIQTTIFSLVYIFDIFPSSFWLVYAVFCSADASDATLVGGRNESKVKVVWKQKHIDSEISDGSGRRVNCGNEWEVKR